MSTASGKSCQPLTSQASPRCQSPWSNRSTTCSAWTFQIWSVHLTTHTAELQQSG
jgi:hypothetical protein